MCQGTGTQLAAGIPLATPSGYSQHFASQAFEGSWFGLILPSHLLEFRFCSQAPQLTTELLSFARHCGSYVLSIWMS